MARSVGQEAGPVVGPDWHVREAGNLGSPLVLLLHGAGLSGRMWTDHMARLGAFHCLAPDLPGCGRSNRVPWTTIDEVADGVAQLIERQVPARRAHVVGISLGGAIAHRLLARHPAVVDRVVIDGAGILPWWGTTPFVVGIAAIAPLLHTRAMIAMLSRSVGAIPQADRAEMRVASRRAFRESYSQALRTRASRAEVEATSPTLLVAGEKERAVRRSNAALAALMAPAVARYVPGVGHGWLGRRMDLHVEMVEAWITGKAMPSDLLVERPWPAAVRQLLRQIEPPA